jgi:hypothetical protein
MTTWSKRFARLRDEGLPYAHALAVWRMLNGASTFGSRRTADSALYELRKLYRIVPCTDAAVDVAIEVACHRLAGMVPS